MVFGEVFADDYVLIEYLCFMRVYLIKNSEDHYKIGYSGRRVHKRLEELQTANGGELWFISEFESMHARKIEAVLHNLYSAYRLAGGGKEWFLLPASEVLLFKKRAQDVERNLVALEKRDVV